MTYPSQHASIPVPELENSNIDRSVNPPVMVRGGLHKTSAGGYDFNTGQPATQAVQTDGTQKTQITNGTIEADLKTNINTANVELLVNLEGHQCPGNTTSTPLGIDGVFTGSTWQDTLDYGVLSINVYTDKASATNGLDIQWSNDGVNVRDHDYFTLLAGDSKTFTFGPAERYYRVVYTNGATAQTSFHLTSLLRKCYVKPSSHRINDAIVGQDDAELVKAVLTGLAPDGAFKNVLATNAGNQKISIEEFETDVSTTLADSSDQLDNKICLNTAAAIFGRTNGNVRPIEIDASTHALPTLDFGHHELHEGNNFFVKNWVDLTNGQVLDFLCVTPDTTKYAHMIVEFAFEAEANIIVYEGTTTSNNGTSVTTVNRNRNSASTSTTVLYTGPTVTATGTQIAAYKAGSGRSIGGEPASMAELILKRNTKYLIRVTNDTVTNNWFGYLADWYEHTDLN